MRVKQYIKNPKDSTYFYDSRFFRGILLLGTMEVLQDQTTKDRIWRDSDTMFYSLGVTAPDYCVLKFTTLIAGCTNTSNPTILQCRVEFRTRPPELIF